MIRRLLSRLYHGTLCSPCRTGAVWLGPGNGHVLRENRRVRAGLLVTPRDHRILH